MNNEEKDINTQNNIEVFSLNSEQPINNSDSNANMENSQLNTTASTMEQTYNMPTYEETAQEVENQENTPDYSQVSVSPMEQVEKVIDSNTDDNDDKDNIVQSNENKLNKKDNNHAVQNNKDAKNNFVFMIVLALIMLAIVIVLPYISGYK